MKRSLNKGGVHHDKIPFTVRFCCATCHQCFIFITAESQRNLLFLLVNKIPVWNTLLLFVLFAGIPHLTFYQGTNRH